MSELPFDKDGSTIINLARLHHLATLCLPLAGKRVLEVGAGVGKLTWFFEELDCEIVSTDGRSGNCETNLYRHPWREGRVFAADLERHGDHKRWGRFDVVFCYGTLYHLTTPLETLTELASVCDELFLLSTVVGTKDDGIHLGSDTTRADASLRGVGCNPAIDWILSTLRGLYRYAIMPYPQPYHQDFVTERRPGDSGHVRAMFAASRKPLEML